jgi:hypothetical protein
MEPSGYSLIASSPIDACRGRGKYKIEPNHFIYLIIQTPKGRKTLRNSVKNSIINKQIITK